MKLKYCTYIQDIVNLLTYLVIIPFALLGLLLVAAVWVCTQLMELRKWIDFKVGNMLLLSSSEYRRGEVQLETPAEATAADAYKAMEEKQ